MAVLQLDSKEKKRDTNKPRNEKDVTNNSTEIIMIRDCYEQLWTNKFHNPEEMDKFLETYQYNLPSLNHETGNLNRLGRRKLNQYSKLPQQTKVQVQNS